MYFKNSLINYSSAIPLQREERLYRPFQKAMLNWAASQYKNDFYNTVLQSYELLEEMD